SSNPDKTVVCMTMNFIGEYKRLPLSEAVFSYHYDMLKKLLCVTDSEIFHKPTGHSAFFITQYSPEYTKSLCEKVEDHGDIGRLFDIDVFDSTGKKLSRNTPRKCLLCNKNAAECSRSRAHGVDAVRRYTQQILCDFFASNVSRMAYDALCDEVSATPKPGLVDRNNSGANPDMTYDMFIRSANAVSPYIGEMFANAALYENADDTMAKSMQLTGLEAESAMYAVTGNINTHKGAIYSMGLLSAGAGFALAGGLSFTDAVKVASHLALCLSYDIKDTNTHGLLACKKYGVTGARGEAIGGFKTVLYAFERIKYYMDDLGLDSNQSYPLAINDVMAVMKDTNVLHRAGEEGLAYLQSEASEIAKMRVNQRIDDMKELDAELISRNISPGGCADALACALFLLKVESLFRT
ncbi:MAG: triphosphoribosyl-dephospho-CoA synthase, partial [Clostridia bacterium]|nr:triphosphoribosyl-dephospho-CoA synthase [Clostridia bacterium]